MMNLLFSVAVVATTVIATPNVFNIQLVFDSSVNAEQQKVFETAKAKWESVIKSDIGGKVTIAAGERVCGQPPLAADLVVDDVLIFAKFSHIDGEGKVTVSSGPCGFTGKKVRLGSLQFDSADVQTLIDDGTFAATVQHEMGHILGLGRVWDDRGLAGKNLIPGTTSFNYFGGNGVAGHRDIGGTGNAVVEGDGGPGSARAHWDKETYGDELMTGTITGATQPMSRLTVRSLQDIGYNVDANKADDFFINGATKAPAGGQAGATKAPVVTKAPVTKAPVTKKPTNAPVTKAPSQPGATKAPVTNNNNNNNNAQGFQLTLSFQGGNVPDNVQAAFQAAAKKWESIITNDIGATVTILKGQVVCNLPPQAEDLVVDDMLVFVSVANIDGSGKSQVQGGPCAFDQGNRARLGSVTLDLADIDQLASDNKLVSLATHEIGHILGIGTVWDQRGLAGKLLIAGTTSVRYFGPSGNQGHKEIGGQGNNGIVEGDGGPGIARAHWDKETYGDELMTGFLTGSSQPLSALTVRSLFDIGFNIDATKVDPFTIPQATGRRLRMLVDEVQWETSWQGEITWDLFPMSKELSLSEDTWELDYQGAVKTDLVEEGSGSVDAGAVAGGLIGTLAVVGAAALVVVRRRRTNSIGDVKAKQQSVTVSSQSRSSSLTAHNPMFNNDKMVVVVGGGGMAGYNGNNSMQSGQGPLYEYGGQETNNYGYGAQATNSYGYGGGQEPVYNYNQGQMYSTHQQQQQQYYQ